MGHRGEPERTVGSWTIDLLGEFGVRRNGQWVRLPPATTRLVAFIALQGRPVARAYVAGSLWMDDSQDRAFANLRSALWRLRQHAESLIAADSRTIGLGSSVSVDAARVDEVVEQLNRNGHIQEAFLATDLFTRELLPGWSDDWTVFERERHRQRSLHALEAIAQFLADSGRCALAIDTALKAIEMDPLRESAHRALIRAHVAEGNYSEALHHYDMYKQLIEAELGITPSPLLFDSITALNDREQAEGASQSR